MKIMLNGQELRNHQGSSGWLYVGMFIGVAIIYFLSFKMGIVSAIIFAGLPFVLIFSLLIIQKLTFSFFVLFAMNYLIMGINRYYSIKPGILMTVFVLGLLFLVFLQNMYQQIEWKRSKNLLVALWSIWFIYCAGELFNPDALFEPWIQGMSLIALFPVVIPIFVAVLLTKYKHVHWLLIIWAVLTLLAAAKGYWQKNWGFDTTELNWLYNYGGASTHLIYTGIRYFSIFTDAANFGSGMGLSLVTFGISSFYVRNKWLKLLFWTAAIAGGYGLMISGTRSAIAVPFFGFALYVLFCRNIKAILLVGLLLVGAFVFLNFTKIGDDNRFIHRMRTAFDTEDASFLVRSYNKQKIYQQIIDKPFGVGLGLGGGKAKRFKPDAPLSQIATDSWLVQLWVETGIVGLSMYLTIIILILYKGAYIANCEIRNKELRGILLAMLGGIGGIIVSSYGNEVLSFPNGITIFTLMGIIFTAKHYDKELTINEQKS